MKERKKRKYRRYSQEFKEKIVTEYAEGQLTCRELGAKYGLTKGETRDIINRHRRKQKLKDISLITDKTVCSKDTVDEETKKYIKSLENKVLFLSCYNEVLEEKIEEDKKKRKLLLLQELMKKADK